MTPVRCLLPEALLSERVSSSAMAEILPDHFISDVFSTLGAKGCNIAACVSRKWNSIASADDIWQNYCLEDFSLSLPEDPQGNPCSSFKVAYERWHQEFKNYDVRLVYRAKRMWEHLRDYFKSNDLEIAESLANGALEEEITKVEKALGWKLPQSARLVYRFCNGQHIGRPDTHSSDFCTGLLGGYSYYDQFVNMRLLPLKQMLTYTKYIIPQLGLPKNSKHVVIAASAHQKFFFLDCDDGMVYVGTHNLQLGEMMACVPSEFRSSRDGMLCWLEEYCNRLLSGMYGVRNNDGHWSISLFPEKAPFCTEAVTHGVQIRASAVFLPEMSSCDGDYCFAYSIRMRLLSDRATPRFESCQLLKRHWVIQEDNKILNEVRGEAVIGKYPLLKEGGEAFVYESMSNQRTLKCFFGGDFTFVPGSIMKPEGAEFNVLVASFPMEVPEYIY